MNYEKLIKELGELLVGRLAELHPKKATETLAELNAIVENALAGQDFAERKETAPVKAIKNAERMSIIAYYERTAAETEDEEAARWMRYCAGLIKEFGDDA